MRIAAPNYTQAPNALFDEWLPKLNFVELKVLMVIMRKTFGWHKIRDRISLSQLEILTGSRRTAIGKATRKLEKLGLISKTKEGKSGAENTYYALIVIEDSNSSYQSPKDTPPSLLKRPTKETPTKEKEEREREREGASPPSDPPTHSLFIQGKVKMAQEKHQKLIDTFGAFHVADYVERLEDFSGTNAERFEKYTCHAAVIRSWLKRDGVKPISRNSDARMAVRIPQNKLHPDEKWLDSIMMNRRKLQWEGKIEMLKGYVNFPDVPEAKFRYGEHGFREKVRSTFRKMDIIIDEN